QKPHPPIWIGGGTQPSARIYGQDVPSIEPVLRRIAKYATTWVPHSSATAEMVAQDWEQIRAYMVELGRDPDELKKVYSNFIHVLAPASAPNPPRRSSRSTAAWTSSTGRSSTCSARPNRWPSGSAARSRRWAASTT